MAQFTCLHLYCRAPGRMEDPGLQYHKQDQIPREFKEIRY